MRCKLIENKDQKEIMKKKLLLHSCCAPCSSGVVPQLNEYDITLFFYNPNIDTLVEYNCRLDALKEYVQKFNSEFNANIKYIAIPYEHEEFLTQTSSFASEKEGGSRCNICIELRLDITAKYAKENDYDLFSSTLSVSPHKNHIMINNIGNNLSKKYNVAYLENNFKKNNGFLHSIENSKKYNLYRQKYCGCEFAKSHLSK